MKIAEVPGNLQDNPYLSLISEFNSSVLLSLEELSFSTEITNHELAVVIDIARRIREEIFLAFDIEDLIDMDLTNSNAGFLKVERRLATAPIRAQSMVMIRNCCLAFLRNLRVVYQSMSSNPEQYPRPMPDEQNRCALAPGETPNRSEEVLHVAETAFAVQNAISVQNGICLAILESIIEEIGIDDPLAITRLEDDLEEDQLLALRYKPFLHHAYAQRIAYTGDPNPTMSPIEVMRYMESQSVRFAYTTAIREIFLNARRDSRDLFYHPSNLYRFNTGPSWVELVRNLEIDGVPVREIFYAG